MDSTEPPVALSGGGDLHTEPLLAKGSIHNSESVDFSFVVLEIVLRVGFVFNFNVCILFPRVW